MVTRAEAENGTELAAASAMVTSGIMMATNTDELSTRTLGAVLAIAGIGVYYIRELRKRTDNRYNNKPERDN